jgi:hypothetical protein
MISSIGGILSKFTGMGAGTISSLLGLAAPLCWGISRENRFHEAWMHPVWPACSRARSRKSSPRCPPVFPGC